MFKTGYQHFRGNLRSSLENKFYENAYLALKSVHDRVLIPDFLSLERAAEIIRCVYEENPSFFYFSPYHITFVQEECNRYIDFCLIYDRGTIDYYEKKIKELIFDFFIKSDIIHRPLYDQIFAVYELLRTQARYDVKIATKVEPCVNEDYNIVGIFKNRTAVCYGFALTFKLFCDELGIRCMVVQGNIYNDTKRPHAWNMVEFDGVFYHIDVVWDMNTRRKTHMNYMHFMVGSDCIKKTRSINFEDTLPKSDVFEGKSVKSRKN